MTKHGNTIAMLTLAIGAATASAAHADTYITSTQTSDPGYERMSESKSFQDWINQRQNEGTLGNRAVVREYGDTYVRPDMVLIVPDSSTLPPNFTQSDRVGESPNTTIIVTPGSSDYRQR